MKKTENLMTVQQAAEKMGVSAARVTALCREGRVAGARKVGRDWILPGEPRIAAAARQRPGKVVLEPAKKKGDAQ